jgi:hypothetical protein
MFSEPAKYGVKKESRGFYIPALPFSSEALPPRRMP